MARVAGCYCVFVKALSLSVRLRQRVEIRSVTGGKAMKSDKNRERGSRILFQLLLAENARARNPTKPSSISPKPAKKFLRAGRIEAATVVQT